jgi:primosomal protein N' (replication factor Y)
MFLTDVIATTKIPRTQPLILSYFSSYNLLPGALVQIPLGRRKEIGVVVDSHKITDYKLEIKKAEFELKNILKIISSSPVLTPAQIKLALFCGQYYFISPGLFAKMMLPKNTNPKQQDTKIRTQKLILAPTIAQAEKIASGTKDTILWHGNLTKKQRNEIWWKIKNGKAKIIVGTRSAVFLPFNNLREIIIEDRQNPNHKSWDMFPHYDSQLIAQKLAEIFDAGIKLKSRDFISREAHKKPSAQIIDMRRELKDGNFSIFSRALQIAIKNTLAQKRQIILFINRRGAANFVLCRDCGYMQKCQNCDAPLAYHLINSKPTLLCHRCNHKKIPFSLCPQCQSWRIKTVGAGTQKAELETKKLFPEAKILRLDSDNAPNPKDQQKIIDAFARKESNVLITTQIILSWREQLQTTKPATGAILSADTLLHLPDFRSGEKTWQIIAALKKIATKNIIIQTYNPASSVIKYAAKNNFRLFWQEELETRQALNYPPYSQIIKLTFRYKDPGKASQEAKILAAKLQKINKDGKIQISSALPAFIPREKGKYVWNIILKFKIENLKLKINNEFLRKRNSLLQYVPQNWEIDVDPEDLL